MRIRRMQIAHNIDVTAAAAAAAETVQWNATSWNSFPVCQERMCGKRINFADLHSSCDDIKMKSYEQDCDLTVLF
jgi:hypothetical protein